MRLPLPAITPLLGILPPSPSCPATLSILGSVGFDFFFLDLEHNPVPSNLPDLLRLTKSMGTPSLVRMPFSTENYQRILDAGATNVLCPMVSTAEEARAVVEASKFPPLGRRGCAGGPWNDFSTAPDAFSVSKANAKVCVGVQIETIEGVSNAREIASTEGVDWVFLGPLDLAISMGYIETKEGWRHEEVKKVVQEGGGIVREEGKEVILDGWSGATAATPPPT